MAITQRMSVVNGHLSVAGSRFRCVGTNLATSGVAPTTAAADEIVAGLVANGINIVRLHAVDGAILDNHTTGTLNAAEVDKVDYLISELAAADIYIIFNFNQSRLYDDQGWTTSHPDSQAFYNSTVQARRRALTTTWLERTNPYLGGTLLTHPVCAMWQIINEEGAMLRWVTGHCAKTDPAHTELDDYWKAWSGETYNLPAWEIGTAENRRVFECLTTLDKEFFDSEYTWLKYTLGFEGLIFGTQEEYTAPGATDGMDLQDVHAYHDHWNGSYGSSETQPLFVKNNSFARMVDNTAEWGATNLVWRIHGMNPDMPRIVTEFNWSGLHETFEEVPLFYALLSLQDMDGAFDFLYTSTGTDTGLTRDYIRGNDTRLNPLWMINQNVAGKAFQEARIAPLPTNTQEVAEMTASQVLDLGNDATTGVTLISGVTYNVAFHGGSYNALRSIVSKKVGTKVAAASNVPVAYTLDDKNGWDWDTGAVSLAGTKYDLDSILTGTLDIRGATITAPATVQDLRAIPTGDYSEIVTSGGKITNTNVDWYTETFTSNTGTTVTITLDTAFGDGALDTPQVHWPVVITGSDSTPSLNGTHVIASRISASQFTIVPPAEITDAGTGGTLTFGRNAWGNSTGAPNIGWGIGPPVPAYNPAIAGMTPLDFDGAATTGAAYWYAIMSTISFTDGPRVTALNTNSVSATATAISDATGWTADEHVYIVKTTGALETFTPRFRDTGVYSGTIHWGDGETSAVSTFSGNSHEYAVADEYTVRYNGAFPHPQWNSDAEGSKDKVIEFLNFGDVAIGGNYWAFFKGCSAMTAYDSGTTTLGLATFSQFMQDCTTLVTADMSAFDFSVGTVNFSSAFTSCSALTTITGIENIRPTSLTATFKGCSQLVNVDVSSWDLTACTTLNSTFLNCSNLAITGLDTLDITNITDAEYFIYNTPALSTTAYSNALNAWDALPGPLASETTPYTMHMGPSYYNSGAAAAHASLTTKGITFNDLGQEA